VLKPLSLYLHCCTLQGSTEAGCDPALVHWLKSVTAALLASKHETLRVREPVLQGCEQELQLPVFHVHAALLQLWVVSGLLPATHCESAATAPVLDMHGTERVWLPPPQRAEQELHAPGAHWYVTQMAVLHVC